MDAREQTESSSGLAARVAAAVVGRARAVLILAVVVTAALAIPFLAMQPDEFASQEPEGRVFEARDELQERFGGGVVGWFFIVEARDGEMLDRDSMLALTERVEAVQANPTYGPLLLPRTSAETGQTFDGVISLAGFVDAALEQAGMGGLEGADDDAVRAVASEIIDARGPGELGVSAEAERDDATGLWSAPALSVSLLVDGNGIEGRGDDAGFGSDVAVEEAGREVQAILRDTNALDVWGVALDQGLTASEQGEKAGPFIGFTVLAIVLLVGVAFRSYWPLAVVGAALVALLVWLEGITNLIGMKEDQILSTVVPIAMLSFGVDYAFHSVGRYREERAETPDQLGAVRRGLTGVLPALVLALATGVVAFLSNLASGIESIFQFGLAAAIALVSAFVVLGIVVPVAVALIDRRVAGRKPSWSRPLSIAGSLGAASAAMAAVLFTVFLAPPVGLGLLALYLVVFLGLPLLAAGRVNRGDASSQTRRTEGGGRFGSALAGTVVSVAKRRALVLPAALLLSAVAAVYAVQVPSSFDVEDFFAQDTDFVVGLEKLDQHVGDQAGEEAVVLVSGDLDDPEAQAALASFADRLEQLDTDLLAHGSDGRVLVERDALAVLDRTSSLTPVEAAQVVAPADDDGLMAARISVGLVGSRAQENVQAARDLLEPMVAELEAELAAIEPGSQATLTGTPVARVASLDAVSRSMQVSIPIAVVLCLLVVWAFMRSLRYALVSLVPILLVVVWLYGFMYAAGYSLNLVTATIGAISIGVGIDFATHLAMRYREELERASSRLEALRAAAGGTGMALVGSTLSSVAGFAILAFAPMPMFASYGLLTAVMIALALIASLLVLPGLLLLISREPAPAQAAAGADKEIILPDAAPRIAPAG